MAKKISKLFMTIKNAKDSEILIEPFRVSDVNAACNGLLMKSPSFLSKHRKDNPGGHYEYFDRDAMGEYRLL